MADSSNHPVKAVERGVHEAKTALSKAMTGLADVKDRAARTRRDEEKNRRLAEDYEKKAIDFLKKMQAGELERTEAERLATQALERKQDYDVDRNKLAREAEEMERTAEELQIQVNEIRSTIDQMENELLTLKARARTAEAAVNVGEALNRFDHSAGESLIERMKVKVEAEEDLAEAYGEMADREKRLEAKFEEALGEDPKSRAERSLLELKKKMGME